MTLGAVEFIHRYLLRVFSVSLHDSGWLRL